MAELASEAKLKDKNNFRKKLENTIRRLRFDLKRKISFIPTNAIVYQRNIVIKSWSKATKWLDNEKLKNVDKVQKSTIFCFIKDILLQPIIIISVLLYYC